MRLIGLTGGIASGKSTVATLLAGLGAAVVDADVLAREVVAPGSEALEELVDTFGPGMRRPDGTLDRAALGAVVFADERQRRRLEAITHPRISALMASRLERALAGAAPLVVADIPLLFENGRQTMFEGTVVVAVSPAVQIERLTARDGITADEASQRLRAQMPLDEKRGLATWVIDNSGDLAATTEAVRQWWAHNVERDA